MVIQLSLNLCPSRMLSFHGVSCAVATQLFIRKTRVFLTFSSTLWCTLTLFLPLFLSLKKGEPAAEPPWLRAKVVLSLQPKALFK